jgi:hypothetical protein
MEAAADRLFADLSRRGDDGVHFRRNVRLDVPSIGTIDAPIVARSDGRDVIVGIHGPLTPDHADDQRLRDAKEFGTVVPVLLVDEIVITQNLPRASQQVIESLG